MTNLTINPATLISSVLLLISFITFVFAYNKAIKDRVNKTDLSDLKSYVDQQDRSVHHRVDEVNDRVVKVEDQINKKLDLILNKLIK
jgi:hypothetical protein